MKLDEITDMWENDCEISEFNLDEASRQTPSLHAKYLQLRTKAYLGLKKAEADQKVLLKNKWLYYEGKLSHEEIESFGWDFDPFKGLKKPIKGEMHYYYDSDSDIQASEAKVQVAKLKLDTLDEIIQNIKWRSQTIKNMIMWRQFEAGG